MARPLLRSHAMPTQPTSALMLAEGLSRDYLLHHRVCPMALADTGGITVAVAPDAILDALDDIALVYRRPVTAQPTAAPEVERLIERLTTQTERTIELERANAGDDDLTADVRDLA